MSFFKSQSRRESAISLKNQLLLAIGRHAFVHLPHASGRPGESAPMSDDAGWAVANDLTDGQEVEIMAWRPRSPQGLAYRIRRLSDGKEWWIQALYLRQSSLVAAAAE